MGGGNPSSPAESFEWNAGGTLVRFHIGGDAPVALLSWGPHAAAETTVRGWPARQALVEITSVAAGLMHGGATYDESRIGSRLRYVGHAVTEDGRSLSIEQVDEVTGLAVTSVIQSSPGIRSLRVFTRVRNQGRVAVQLTAVSSLALGIELDVDTAHVIQGVSGWTSEGRWSVEPLRAAGIVDYGQLAHERGSPPGRQVISTGSWSTGRALTTGGVQDATRDLTILWQIEHNGAWQYQLAERPDGISLVLLGPTDQESEWAPVLEPGDEIETVPVAVVAATGGLDAAASELTRYRRGLRGDIGTVPLVFNDYMNTLNGDPTTEKLLPLIDAAASAGAECFCIDAGWYDDGGHWWDSVGAWEPSITRFPDGLGVVIERIVARGLVPGLWLEPEVVGVRSPIARTLPSDAFITRHGVRVEQNGRHLLDFRNPLVREHLDGIVDRLIREFRIGFFKFDYNSWIGAGSDAGDTSVGEGLLAHNRGVLAWIDGLRLRHPELVIENCASGAMRMDYAMLSRLHLQSTSDQQDPLRYAPIAASAPMSMTPEQAANWAYPQPGMTRERAIFCLANSMLGTMYLSGYLNRMDAGELALVTEAIETHKTLRPEIAAAVPFWPLGLPRWDDPRLALGLTDGNGSLLTLWDRSGHADLIEIPIPSLRGRRVRVDRVFPVADAAWAYEWDAADGILTVIPQTREPAARVVRITPQPPPGTAGSRRA